MFIDCQPQFRTFGWSIRERVLTWVRQHWLLFGFAALTVTTGCLWRPYIDAPLHVDAAGYALAAYWWSQGDTLYQDISITRPQGIFVVFRLIEAVGFGDARGIHLVGAAVCLLSALLLWWIAARVWGRAIGLSAAIVFVVLMSVPALEGPTVNAELFMLPAILLSLALLLCADDVDHDSPARYCLLLSSGLSAAIAVLLKPAGIAAFPFAILWLLRHKWRSRITWRVACGEIATVSIGLGLGLLPALIHGMLTVPERYLYDVYLYRLGQDSVANNGLAYQAYHLLRSGAFIVSRLVILPLAAFGLWRVRRASSLQRDLLWLWIVTWFAGVSLGGNWYPHYFQQLVPPFAIALVLCLPRVCQRARSRPQIVVQGIALVGSVQLLVTILSVQLPHQAEERLFVKSDPENYTPSAISSPLAAYIREHTTPDESIYVVYHRADIYYLASRRPAARWLYIRELVLTPGAFADQEARLTDPQTAPTYIVGMQPFNVYGLDAHGQIRAAIAREYRLETTIAGIPLYRRIDRPSVTSGVQEQ